MSEPIPASNTRLSVTEARAILPALLDRVAAGEEITITRHGLDVAVLMPSDRVKTRRKAVQEALARAAELRRQIEASRNQPLLPPALSAERADELIAQIRADRDDDVWSRIERGE